MMMMMNCVLYLLSQLIARIYRADSRDAPILKLSVNEPFTGVIELHRYVYQP